LSQSESTVLCGGGVLVVVVVVVVVVSGVHIFCVVKYVMRLYMEHVMAELYVIF